MLAECVAGLAPQGLEGRAAPAVQGRRCATRGGSHGGVPAAASCTPPPHTRPHAQKIRYGKCHTSVWLYRNYWHAWCCLFRHLASGLSKIWKFLHNFTVSLWRHHQSRVGEALHTCCINISTPKNHSSLYMYTCYTNANNCLINDNIKYMLYIKYCRSWESTIHPPVTPAAHSSTTGYGASSDG